MLHELNTGFSVRCQKEEEFNSAQNAGIWGLGFFKLKRAPNPQTLPSFLSSPDSFDSSQAVDVSFYQRQKTITMATKLCWE